MFAAKLAIRFPFSPLALRSLVITVLVLVATGIGMGRALATSRIKDLATVEGVRENMLVGYGLVVGLDGSGDSLSNSPFTLQSLQGMLERLGVNTRGTNLKTKNVAAVMVTGNLPAFAAQGSHMDVTVSALGDAKSLRGGTLLVTPLLGADGEVYSVAQGQIAGAGISVQGAAASLSQGVATTGRIANGAIVEREINFELASMSTLRLSLRNPDFTTARRISQAINSFLGADTAAVPTDPGTVQLVKPKSYRGDVISLVTDIEQLRVDPDEIARVVIDEASGIIVMGSDVRVSTVAIAQGNLTIRITETPQVSQPDPFSQGGTTQVVPRTTIEIAEDKAKLAVMNEGVTLQSLVDGLNALGIGPRDLISILQAIKTAGALQADIEVM